MKELQLSNGMTVIVDEEDFERLNSYVWYSVIGKKEISVVRSGDISLGREILGLNNNDRWIVIRKKQVLDYRKENLKAIPKEYKNRYTRSAEGSTSKYKGVSWDKQHGKWKVSIKVGSKFKNLGRFDNEDKAALAYNKAVLLYWEGNGLLNEIGQDNRTLTIKEDYFV